MESFPADRYHFRMVLTNVLMMPCAVVSLIALYPLIQSPYVYWFLSLSLGFAMAYAMGWLLHLSGIAMFRFLDRVLGGKKGD
ncbi:MAG TPA: hypothetical protein VMP01_20525 [Pirellulaceae bacterium]|nr:hypothetical protein [Pirellulaceae bacterium]